MTEPKLILPSVILKKQVEEAVEEAKVQIRKVLEIQMREELEIQMKEKLEMQAREELCSVYEEFLHTAQNKPI